MLRWLYLKGMDDATHSLLKDGSFRGGQIMVQPSTVLSHPAQTKLRWDDFSAAQQVNRPNTSLPKALFGKPDVHVSSVMGDAHLREDQTALGDRRRTDCKIEAGLIRLTHRKGEL